MVKTDRFQIARFKMHGHINQFLKCIGIDTVQLCGISDYAVLIATSINQRHFNGSPPIFHCKVHGRGIKSGPNSLLIEYFPQSIE